MNVELLFFASVREAADQPQMTLELPAGTTAAGALVRLFTRLPALAALGPSLRLAVNEEFVAPEHELHDGDRLALIPPVSGG